MTTELPEPPTERRQAAEATLSLHITHAGAKHQPIAHTGEALQLLDARLKMLADAHNGGTNDTRDARTARRLYQVAAIAMRALVDLQLPEVTPEEEEEEIPSGVGPRI